MYATEFIEKVKSEPLDTFYDIRVTGEFILDNKATFSALITSGTTMTSNVLPETQDLEPSETEHDTKITETCTDHVLPMFSLTMPTVATPVVHVQPHIAHVELTSRVPFLIVTKNSVRDVLGYGSSTNVPHDGTYANFVEYCREKFAYVDTLVVGDENVVFTKNFAKMVHKFVEPFITGDTIIGHSDDTIPGDKILFTHAFYSAAYPDIEASGCKTPDKQRKHFLTVGLKQHRFGTSTIVKGISKCSGESARILKGGATFNGTSVDVVVPSFCSQRVV